MSTPEEPLPYFVRMANMGAHALEHGLPELPQTLAPGASVPVAYWKSESRASVMFLSHRPHSTMQTELTVWHANYDRIDDEWIGDPRMAGVPCWFGSDGPSGSPDGFGGKAVILGGWRGSDTADGRPGVVWGWQSPDVSQVLLVQGDHRVMPQVIGHFGAWMIGMEHAEPWTVEARDSSGDLMGSAQGPRPQEVPLEVIPVSLVEATHSSGGRMNVMAIERYERKFAVNWEFSFPEDTASLLSASDEAEVQDRMRSGSYGKPAEREKRQEEWRRLGFMLRLTVTDDLGTEYEHVGGGGSASAPVANWTSTFKPAIPEATSFLSIRKGETVVLVPLS
jgi:hypothetical protein